MNNDKKNDSSATQPVQTKLPALETAEEIGESDLDNVTGGCESGSSVTVSSCGLGSGKLKIS